MFSDEATFYLSGKFNCHNVRVWSTENPHEIIKHVWDWPKQDVFCAVSSVKLYGPFFFVRPTLTGISYLDMLGNYLMPQLQQDMDRDFIFQQGEVPPHFHRKVASYLNCTVFALDWTWWNDSLATTITWFNIPGLSCVGIH